MGGPGEAQRSPPGDRCLACGAPLHYMGVEQFRTGGSTGGWKLLFGEWAELGEGMLPLAMYACPSCGRVEIRVARPPR